MSYVNSNTNVQTSSLNNGDEVYQSSTIILRKGSNSASVSVVDDLENKSGQTSPSRTREDSSSYRSLLNDRYVKKGPIGMYAEKQVRDGVEKRKQARLLKEGQTTCDRLQSGSLVKCITCQPKSISNIESADVDSTAGDVLCGPCRAFSLSPARKDEMAMKEMKPRGSSEDPKLTETENKEIKKTVQKSVQGVLELLSKDAGFMHALVRHKAADSKIAGMSDELFIQVINKLQEHVDSAQHLSDKPSTPLGALAKGTGMAVGGGCASVNLMGLFYTNDPVYYIYAFMAYIGLFHLYTEEFLQFVNNTCEMYDDLEAKGHLDGKTRLQAIMTLVVAEWNQLSFSHKCLAPVGLGLALFSPFLDAYNAYSGILGKTGYASLGYVAFCSNYFMECFLPVTLCTKQLDSGIRETRNLMYGAQEYRAQSEGCVEYMRLIMHALENGLENVTDIPTRNTITGRDYLHLLFRMNPDLIQNSTTLYNFLVQNSKLFKTFKNLLNKYENGESLTPKEQSQLRVGKESCGHIIKMLQALTASSKTEHNEIISRQYKSHVRLFSSTNATLTGLLSDDNLRNYVKAELSGRPEENGASSLKIRLQAGVDLGSRTTLIGLIGMCYGKAFIAGTYLETYMTQIATMNSTLNSFADSYTNGTAKVWSTMAKYTGGHNVTNVLHGATVSGGVDFSQALDSLTTCDKLTILDTLKMLEHQKTFVVLGGQFAYYCQAVTLSEVFLINVKMMSRFIVGLAFSGRAKQAAVIASAGATFGRSKATALLSTCLGLLGGFGYFLLTQGKEAQMVKLETVRTCTGANVGKLVAPSHIPYIGTMVPWSLLIILGPLTVCKAARILHNSVFASYNAYVEDIVNGHTHEYFKLTAEQLDECISLNRINSSSSQEVRYDESDGSYDMPRDLLVDLNFNDEDERREEIGFIDEGEAFVATEGNLKDRKAAISKLSEGLDALSPEQLQFIDSNLDLDFDCETTKARGEFSLKSYLKGHNLEVADSATPSETTPIICDDSTSSLGADSGLRLRALSRVAVSTQTDSVEGLDKLESVLVKERNDQLTSLMNEMDALTEEHSKAIVTESSKDGATDDLHKELGDIAASESESDVIKASESDV